MNKIMQQARGMIGARLRHDGQNCTVIEVLEDRLEFILEADNPTPAIQSDAYGNARREMRALCDGSRRILPPYSMKQGMNCIPPYLSLMDFRITPKKN
ncbi:MAG: hypothetical protein HZA59_09240 [Hydrogenophilales bacterium]|nr:hypothetical protein [Hydrogenophilales bacterium]